MTGTQWLITGLRVAWVSLGLLGFIVIARALFEAMEAKEAVLRSKRNGYRRQLAGLHCRDEWFNLGFIACILGMGLISVIITPPSDQERQQASIIFAFICMGLELSLGLRAELAGRSRRRITRLMDAEDKAWYNRLHGQDALVKTDGTPLHEDDPAWADQE